MKILVVIAVAALSASIGETLMSYGMRKYGGISLTEPSQVLTLVLSVVRNPYVAAGVLFLAIFFFLYLAALSWADLSYVLPLTAMSYIFAALLARFALKEDVSWMRWAGTVLIVLGIACVALDDRPKETLERGGDRPGREKGEVTGPEHGGGT
jgi:drug/metabolite transporter (DMT)-like permease